MWAAELIVMAIVFIELQEFDVCNKRSNIKIDIFHLIQHDYS